MVAVERDEVLRAINWITGQTPGAVFFDLETMGLSFEDINRKITNVGLATDDWVAGLSLVDLTEDEVLPLWDWLAEQQLGGFNLGFDLAWPWRIGTPDGRVKQNIDDLNIFSDVLLWFRLLATEAHFGQTHTLEELTKRVLGWPDADQQKSWLKDTLDHYKLGKDQMYRLSILEPLEYTRYCALDAEASFQGHKAMFYALKKHDLIRLGAYHDNILVPKIKRNIHQTCSGIRIDRPKLRRNLDWVHQRMAVLEAKMLAHPMMAEYAAQWELDAVEKTYALRPYLKKHWAKKSDEPWNHPDVWRLQLFPPERLAKEPKWVQEYGGRFYKPETKFSIKGAQSEWPRFNVNSANEMRTFIYEHLLGGKYKIWHRNPEKPEWGGLVTVWYNDREYQFDLTDAGAVPTGGDILSIFGEFGALLREYKKLQKLEGDFLSKYYEASARTGRIHPQTKILGTVTGRGAGGSA